MVDKFQVKEYAANKIRQEYSIPTLDVWEKLEDWNEKFDNLIDIDQ